MPTYEREHLLAEALESALAQTYTDIVVAVGDNSDSHATEKLLSTYDDPRIRYHRNRPGLGALGNWLDLVQRADTPLIATLHDDDLWDPDYLATVVPPMLDDPSIAMTFNDFWVIDEEGRVQETYTEEESARTHRSSIPAGRFDYDLVEGLRLVAVWNAPQPCYAALIRRDEILATDYIPEIHPLYDIWTSYNLVKRGAGLRYEPRRLTRYRVHPNTGTNDNRYTVAEDAVFRHIIDENRNLGTITQEINSYWSTIRWFRATRLMGDGPQGRPRSQEQLLAAAPGLPGVRRVVATVAGRSPLVWNGLRLLRTARRRSSGVYDIRYTTSSTS
jgi:glycosyltransferase involved in cell wall biosynthesis